MPSDTLPLALVTGSNAGIGRATALALARHGFRVIASCRNPDKARDLAQEAQAEGLPLEIMQLDVTDSESIARCLSQVRHAFGPIDVLVNNAGFGVIRTIEDAGLNEVRALFETNVFGSLALTQAVLPEMRERRRGRIINVSSLSGMTSFPTAGLYSATKFALEALSDALRVEVRRLGIRVIVVQPGPIATNFERTAFGKSREAELVSAYSDVYTAMHASHQQFKLFERPASDVAKVIVKAAKCRNPRARYTVTLPAKIVPFFSRLLPTRLFDWFQLRLIRRLSNRPALPQHTPTRELVSPEAMRSGVE